ncbi:N-acetylmannosamine kinase [Dongshaea marina]|uniref:N-acetylmannosamine kinase n=1 Tax=Dongshaea marina TaxID=2047966 RepID=UPI000D3E15FD|nr:N-acetylmannosamine kinase [Dongshaea marina]
MILAIDLGGTKLAAALFDGEQLCDRIQFKTHSSGDPGTLKDQLQSLLHHYQGRFDCIGVASTGIIQQGRLTALNPDNLGGLKGFDLEVFFQQIFPGPIALLNDAQAATFGESVARDNAANLAFITVSTGIGGGLMINGELLRGGSGHLGHTLADPDGPVCGCGRRGCIEAVASGSALSRLGSEALRREVCARELLELAQSDTRAEQIVDRACLSVAGLIADLQASLAVGRVVVGGSVGLNPLFFDRVTLALASNPAFYRPVVESAVLGADAGLYGISHWVKQFHR